MYQHRIGQLFNLDGQQYQHNQWNFDGAMSQVYFIDGQALGPEIFWIH